MFTVVVFLFVLGLCAGSFVNALVWRIHQQSKQSRSRKVSQPDSPKKTTNYELRTTNYSILSGRSQCPNCRHQLAIRDLIPILSWLVLRGKCRYCQKPISAQYPLVELAAGAVFAISYLFWLSPVELTLDSTGAGDLILFITWLGVSIGLLALLVYDYKWMLLPNRILYPTALIAITGRLIYTLGFENDVSASLVQWLLSVAMASGIFLLIFAVSDGKWIGYGDVRLGIITGTVLASPAESLLMIFTASVLGVLFVLPALITGRQKLAGKVPFGPFLITATFLVLLFGQQIIDWYQGLLS